MFKTPFACLMYKMVERPDVWQGAVEGDEVADVLVEGVVLPAQVYSHNNIQGRVRVSPRSGGTSWNPAKYGHLDPN